MNKSLIIFCIVVLSSFQMMGQKFFTRNGHLGFFSKTNMEDIKASNESVTYIMDLSTGEINISALQTNFQFEKALMQEHYNENYVESSKFPKAIFKGKIDDMSKVNFKMEGVYNAKVSGNLEIHGVTKPYSVDAVFKVGGGHVLAETNFKVKCADHNIKIESSLKNNIAESIDVNAKADLTELKK
jgi:polyisoprenoid-binding protein YceI